MNILFQSRYQYPLVESGGLGIVVYELMKQLPPICENLEHWTWNSRTTDFEGDIAGMVGFQPYAETQVRDERLALLFNTELTNLSMIQKYDQCSFDFDLIHAHTWEVYLASVTGKHLRNVPLIYTTHDIMVNDAHNEINESADLYGHGVAAEKIMMSEADRIIAVSESNRKTLISAYPEHAEKIVVIPNGVDVDQFTPSARCDTHRPLEKDYMLFVGRAVKSKGIDAIIEMLELLPDEMGMVFAISTHRWDGQKHRDADDYVAKIGRILETRPNTRLILNEWRRDEVATLYANAALLLAPSTYEPCGMVALEAQACGTPVLTNNVGFMTDSVIDGVTGSVLHLNANNTNDPQAMAGAVRFLFEDPKRLLEMGENGRANVVKNHSWKQRAKQHVELYHELISHSQIGH